MGVAGADRRRGVDGPAMGSDATRRRGVGGSSAGAGSGGGGASCISTSSSSEEIVLNDVALRTGSTRVGVAAAAVARRGVVRGRFEGVSGAKTSSSFSEADASESEKATLRLVGLLMLLAPEGGGGLLVSRMADFVGDADRDGGCDREGVLVGVFDGVPTPSVALVVAFFRRISLMVVRMDSFRSTHSSSIAFTRRENTLSDTPYFSISGACCTVESWSYREGCVSGRRLARVLTHLDRPTDPEEYGDSYFWTRFAETGREIVSKPRKRSESCLGLLHPRFNAQRLPYLVLGDERGVGGWVRSVS